VLVPLLATSFALPAIASDLVQGQGLIWQWMPAEERRFYLENEIVLPDIMWWTADNKEARVVAWQLRAVLDCNQITLEGKRAWDVSCVIPDIAIQAAAMPGDQASSDRASILDPILADIDTRLTGTRVDFTLRDDGRVMRVALPDLPRSEVKEGVMNENLRSVMQRAIAGFDFQLPKDGLAPDGAWMQHESMLFMAPTQSGTMGAAEVLHGVRRQDGDVLLIQTVGKGTVAPFSKADSAASLYTTTLSAAALFDTKRGLLVERSWAMEGRPTAGSAVSEGWAGVSYMQSGMLRLLAPEATAPDLGPTREVSPPGPTPNPLLQQWTAMGGGSPSDR
jgi:hypothetical protein